MTQQEVLKILYENTKAKYGYMKEERSAEYHEKQYLIHELDLFLKNEQEKDDNFMLIIDKIVSDDFDISDYYLYRNPCPEVYCFRNMDNTKGFDIHYFHDRYVYAIASYIDDKNDMQDTDTIHEAVGKYSRRNLL